MFIEVNTEAFLANTSVKLYRLPIMAFCNNSGWATNLQEWNIQKVAIQSSNNSHICLHLHCFQQLR